ncbi:MAG: hypothetical protein K2W78_10805 [Xanthobacteraceae bacterium]|nr:hypothetical protein [Xanthobacteraceae bacterium]
MSVDLSIRPIGASVVTPAIVSSTPEPVKAAVPTQLPPDKSVTAVQTPSQPNPIHSQDLGRQVTIDRAAASIVYQVVDNRTNQVVSQYPDEARLRARAYWRAEGEAKQEKAGQQTDHRA